MQKKTIILCPVYDDSEALNQLLREIAGIFSMQKQEIAFVIVNDGSAKKIAIATVPKFPIQLIHLHRNIGHQKAIAIGLSFIKHQNNCDKVLVMDCDGEDSPEDCLRLLKVSEEHPCKIIFAHRKTRKEGKQFIFFYKLYKAIFRILTGKRISFGNFMVIPAGLLQKLVYYNEIWNNIPSGILRAGLPYQTVETHRAARYIGQSKMNFTSLVLHGLSAIAVFLDIIAIRLLLLSLALICLSIIVISIVISVKVFTNLAIPGWASSVTSSMLIVLLQSFLLSLFTIFLYLAALSQRNFLPANHYSEFIESTEILNGSN